MLLLLQLGAHHKSNRTGEIFSRGLACVCCAVCIGDNVGVPQPVFPVIDNDPCIGLSFQPIDASPVPPLLLLTAHTSYSYMNTQLERQEISYPLVLCVFLFSLTATNRHTLSTFTVAFPCEYKGETNGRMSGTANGRINNQSATWEEETVVKC